MISVPKLFVLLDSRARLVIAALLAMMTASAALEVVGIGLVIPLLEGVGSTGSTIAPFVTRPMERLFTLFGWKNDVESLVTLVAVVFVAKNFIQISLNVFQIRFVQREVALLSTHMLAGYLSLPMGTIFQRNPASLVRNLETSLPTVLEGGLLGFLSFVLESAVMLLLITLILLVDPYATLLSGGVLAVFGLGYYFAIRMRAVRWGGQANAANKRRMQWINQSIAPLKEIKVLGREGYFVDRFGAAALDQARARGNLMIMSQLPRFFFEIAAVFIIATAAIFLASSDRGSGQVMTTLGLLAVATFRLVPSANRLSTAIALMRSAVRPLDELHADATQFARPADSAIASPTTFLSEVLLVGVSFSYRSRDREQSELPAALSEVSLTIRKGEAIGIVGPSGSGKSTLVNVILGLLPLQVGHIQVDGVRIDPADRSWQRALGYVPQDIYLLDDTIRRNIAFAVKDEEVDEEKVWACLARVGLDEFVRGQHHGLGAAVGDRGVLLSGGQRQRIGIARALYHDPEILVLDEATSALDSDAEAAVVDVIAELKGDGTILVIAHRPTTLLSCDRIVELRSGKVVSEKTLPQPSDQGDAS